MVGTGLGARFGILFKGGEPLEMAGKSTIILFDKTGTLTKGKPAVNPAFSRIYALSESGLTEREIWTLLGSAESQSEHLLGRAVTEFCKTSSLFDPPLVLKPVTAFEAESGAGVKSTIDNREVIVGNVRWLNKNDIIIDPSLLEEMSLIQRRGDIAIIAAVDRKVCAIISISDAIKPEAPFVVSTLKKSGMRVLMVTGDHRNSAEAIGEQLGIGKEDIFAQVTPLQKAQIVEKLQNPITNRKGKLVKSVVTFVGDGINDSISLSKADVGVAIGSGTEIAVEAASVVLIRSNLRDLLTAIDLSQATMRRIRWNFAWACVYNFASIPMAAGVFYPIVQISLPPVVAAFAMATSSISVVASSLWLKRYKKPIFPDEEDEKLYNATQARQSAFDEEIELIRNIKHRSSEISLTSVSLDGSEATPNNSPILKSIFGQTELQSAQSFSPRSISLSNPSSPRDFRERVSMNFNSLPMSIQM